MATLAMCMSFSTPNLVIPGPLGTKKILTLVFQSAFLFLLPKLNSTTNTPLLPLPCPH